MSPPTADLEEIPEAECWQLLEQHQLGRVALVVNQQPRIFPVNYDVHNRIVVFRTAKGTKLSSLPGSSVAFEIDDLQPTTGVGWSVVVLGLALDATVARDEVAWMARAASPRPLAPGLKVHWLAINPTQISGRRFRFVPAEGA